MKQVHARFLFVPRSVSLSFSLFLYGHCGFHCDQLVHYRLPLCFEGSITLAAVTAGEKSGRIGSGTSKYDAGVEGWEGKKRRIINSENRAQFGKAGSKCTEFVQNAALISSTTSHPRQIRSQISFSLFLSLFLLLF